MDTAVRVDLITAKCLMKNVKLNDGSELFTLLPVLFFKFP